MSPQPHETDRLSALGDELSALNDELADFNENAAADLVVNTAATQLFVRRRQMNDLLCEVMSAHDDQAALDIMNDPEFRLDPSRRIGHKSFLKQALVFSNQDVIMAILSQQPSVLKKLLADLPIIQIIIEERRKSLIDKILTLPDENCDLILSKLDGYHKSVFLEAEPYRKLLDRAIERNIESKISADDIIQLTTGISNHRFAFFTHNNHNINDRTKTDIANHRDLLKEDRKEWNVLTPTPLFHCIFMGKWTHASRLLDAQNIALDKSHQYNTDKSLSIPTLLHKLAKRHKLPIEAYNFIAAYEVKSGVQKNSIAKAPRRLPKNNKPLRP